jgi:hypothetical protein
MFNSKTHSRCIVVTLLIVAGLFTASATVGQARSMRDACDKEPPANRNADEASGDVRRVADAEVGVPARESLLMISAANNMAIANASVIEALMRRSDVEVAPVPAQPQPSVPDAAWLRAWRLQVANQVLEQQPDAAPEAINTHMWLLWLGRDQPEAQRRVMLEAARARVSEGLERAAESQRDQLRMRAQVAEKRLTQAVANVEQLLTASRQIQATAGRADLRREHVQSWLADLQHRRDELDMERAALLARRDALLRQLDESAKAAHRAESGDEVVAALARVVELRESQLQRLRKLTDRVAEFELNACEEQLMMAKVEFLRARDAARDRVGAERLTHLRNRLADTAVGITEVEARLDFVRRKLGDAEAVKLMELSDRYERDIQSQLEAARASLQSAQEMRRRIETQLEMTVPPTVTLLERMQQQRKKEIQD